MPQNISATEAVMDLSKKYHTEFNYLARTDVRQTSHKAGTPILENWTQYLADKKLIENIPADGKRYAELERTLTSLYIHILLMSASTEEAYLAFTAAQRNNPEIKDILSRDNFKKIQDRQQNFKDDDQLEVLQRLIIYSDIFKSPAISEKLVENNFHSKYQINLAQDSDGLMADVLKNLTAEEIFTILPSFKDMSDKARKMLRSYYPLMIACQGHILFLERGKKTFELMAEALVTIPRNEWEDAMKLVNFAQYLDGMGAQGQSNINGSVTCTNQFAEGYELISENLKLLETALWFIDTSKAATIAFNSYLNERSKWLGYQIPTTPEEKVMTRIGCSIRGSTKEYGDEIKTQFNAAKKQHQELLLTQLGFDDSGLEGFTKLNYIATAIQNVSVNLFIANNFKGGVTKALDAAICLAMLLKEIAKNNLEYLKDPARSISLGEFGFHSQQYPELFDRDLFDATLYVFSPAENKVIATEPRFSTYVSSLRAGSIFKNNEAKAEVSLSVEADNQAKRLAH